MGQLEPNVLITVAGLTPSNENYPVLVNLLKERFGSIPKITAAYMRALYNIPKPERHLKSLRHFYDSLESYVRGLEALGKAPDTYNDLLVCILLDKLPGEIRKNMARQHDQDEWTLEQLRKALRGEIRVMEAGQSSVHHHQQPSSSNDKISNSSIVAVSRLLIFSAVLQSKSRDSRVCFAAGIMLLLNVRKTHRLKRGKRSLRTRNYVLIASVPTKNVSRPQLAVFVDHVIIPVSTRAQQRTTLH